MLVISLLGRTRVQADDGRTWEDFELGGVKERHVLELLALRLGESVPKDALAESLWDGRPPPGHLATVESHVSVLRRRLGMPRGRTGALATTTGGYRLDPREVSVDLVDARLLLRARDPVALSAFVDQRRGPLLASDPYTGWADHERRCFSEELAAVCTGASLRSLEAGRVQEGVGLARAAVRHDPGSESAHRALMRALWRAGERGKALEVFAGLRSRMVSDMGVEPGPTSRRLYLDILRDDACLQRVDDDAELRVLLRLVRQKVMATCPTEAMATVAMARVIDELMPA